MIKNKPLILTRLFSVILLLTFTSCGQLGDDDELEPLVSKIDGEAYYEAYNGEMSTEKAFILIDLDSTEKIPTEHLQIMISNLMHEDSLYREKNFTYLNKINYYISKSFFPEQMLVIQTFIFSKILKYPVETISQIQSLSEFDFTFWTEQLALGYQSQLQLEGITKVSVLNVMLNNCQNCTAEQQEEIVSFIDYLELSSQK